MAIALVLIDLQVDFFRAHARLTRSRATIAARANSLVAGARRSGSPIFWVRQVFAPDLHDAPMDIKRGGHRITIEGTAGVELLPELDVAASDPVITKKRYSAFFGTDLDSRLRDAQCDRLIIGGINSHACVRMTAIDAYQRDYEVFLAGDCIDSHDEEHHAVSMRYLDGRIGQVSANSELEAILRSGNVR